MMKKSIGFLMCLLLAAAFTTEVKAGDKAEVKLTGEIVRKKKGNGKDKWYIKIADKGSFKIRTPRGSAGFKLDDYVGKKVILTFNAVEKTEDGEKKLIIEKTFPIAVKEVKEGTKIPELDPALHLPGLKE